ISSEKIGHLVLESLKGIDDIAYIRFASVYRDFRNASDFHNVIDELSKDATDIESGFDE
ncbi:MAG: transcriptional regulator NrdR, partial [Bartonella sp.]|nr:transcriptional regulator NrdR [Bartonella sp.]